MRSNRFVSCILLLLIALGGCASAEKRFDQGAEMEAKGRYEQAVTRYVQALEKDHTLEAARIRLYEVGNQAIDEQLADSETRVQRGDPVGAATHFRRIDGVVAQARSVGVKLDLPADYEDMRRDAFDDAFDSLIDQSVMAGQQGRWQDGIAFARRAQRDFDPTTDQRYQAMTEEAGLYVDWAHAEYAAGHLRSAFDIAAQVQTLGWSPPEQSEAAALLMDHCLAEGEVELIVLPVQAKGRQNQPGTLGRALSEEVEDMLWLGPWRQPPVFIAMDEPLTVRTLLTESGLMNGRVNPATLALVLRLAEADYAAFLQVIESEITDYNIKAHLQNVKTRRGMPTTFTKETGDWRVTATVRILIADEFGNAIADEVVSGKGAAAFKRGVYSGDPAELNLSPSQIDLFDQSILAEQEMEARLELAEELAAKIADVVYGRTLAEVP